VIQLVRKWRYKNQNFFILDEGRNRNEKAVIAIEKGRYIGFGYMDNEFAAAAPDQLKFFIRNYDDNRDVQRIIQRHLQKAPAERIITY
jgi:DNA polymerase-3 subunit epsilon